MSADTEIKDAADVIGQAFKIIIDLDKQSPRRARGQLGHVKWRLQHAIECIDDARRELAL